MHWIRNAEKISKSAKPEQGSLRLTQVRIRVTSVKNPIKEFVTIRKMYSFSNCFTEFELGAIKPRAVSSKSEWSL